MTEQQSVDPQTIEQTKQQIRGLVAEIAQLAKSDVAPQEFYDALLNRIVSALAAHGGAIWTLSDEGPLELQYQINLQNSGLIVDEQTQQQHGQLLGKAISSGEGMLVPPHSGGGEDDAPANPSEFLLVLGPLMSDRQALGVIEVFQRAGAGPTTQRGYLRFLLQMCELASDYLKTRQLRHFTDRQTLWSQLEYFIRNAHASLEPRETAYTVANEGRRLIECDRVSVALKKGPKCPVVAISGQDQFDKRANNVVMLGELAQRVVATGEAVWYTGDTSDMAPQVEEAVHEYVDETHCKVVGILPLIKPRSVEQTEQQAEAGENEPEEVFGALIVEQIDEGKLTEGTLQRVDVVRDHSAAALSNSLEHQSLFLMPLWRAIGKSKWIVKARTLPKTVTIGGAILLLIISLFIIPADFELEARGTLEPVEQKEVFARVSGVVKKIGYDHGADVKNGVTLLQLGNRDLEAEETDLQGRLDTALQQKAAAEDARKRALDLRPDEDARIGGQIKELEQTIKSLRKQLALTKEKIEQLKVKSPIDGTVVTWDLKNRLEDRPVREGQILLSVANTEGEWELELQMPENHMGHIRRAEQALAERIREAKENGEELSEEEKRLKVTFILATDPGTSHIGQVTEIHTTAEVRGEEGNTVLIRVAVNKEELQQIAELKPGAGVTAKVYCGRESIGYVWFHDLIAFVRSRILFRF